MNKNLFIGIAVLLLLGGGYFYFSKSQVIPIKKATSGLIKGNIQDLFARGANIQCTFKYDDEGNNTEGTIYLSGKKMRGNFSLTQGDGTVFASNIIRDENYGYTWMEGQEQGTKIKIETTEEISETTKENNKKNELFALDDKNIDYDCKPWNVDNSMFTPPSNVKFQDLSAQVEQIKKTTEEFNESKCDTCNQIPAGTTRDQCLQALNCN